MHLRLVMILIFSRSTKCTMEGYILNGEETKISIYPHSVYLHINCNVSFICGGSILNQGIVLTAAHCLEDCHRLVGENVTIKSGHEIVNDMKSTAMEDFYLHEDYDESTMANDICLVVSKQPLKLGKSIQRVAILPNVPDSFRVGYVAGWGVMNNKNDLSSILLTAVQQIQPQEVCKLIQPMPPGTFCAGPITGAGIPDRGDSGSALIAKNYIQIGIVSFTVKNMRLVVYTNISFHYDWIAHTASHIYCKKKVSKNDMTN